MTVDDIIKSALTKLGVIPIGETVPTEFTAMALTEINALIQLWAAEGLNVHVLTEGTFNLVVGQASYTIGASANFNVRRPVEIISGEVTFSGITDPLEVFSSLFRYDAYATHPSGRPSELYYDPTIANGLVKFYLTPDQIYSLHMRSVTSLASFSASTETIVLPPEYELFLSTNLAAHLIPTFGITDGIAVKKASMILAQAAASKTAILRNNAKRLLRESRVDAGLLSTPSGRQTTTV